MKHVNDATQIITPILIINCLLLISITSFILIARVAARASRGVRPLSLFVFSRKNLLLKSMIFTLPSGKIARCCF